MAINTDNGHIIMTGPLQYDFEGEIPPEMLVV